MSVFKNYYEPFAFFDRYKEDSNRGVTVIIPVLHVNELWKANLLSIFREIPVERLLIGNAGMLDEDLEILNDFPRVEVKDHTSFNTLGYSIRKLIEEVPTEWFVYLHSDVYIPEGWFNKMYQYSSQYDWYGCRMQQTILYEFDNDYLDRPYAGSQFGRTALFSSLVSSIDDDYVYRQEDFVFSELCSSVGGREGKVDEVFHYHQSMPKTHTGFGPSPTKVIFATTTSDQELIRIWESQAKGIVKYLKPNSTFVVHDAGYGFWILLSRKIMTKSEIKSWVINTDPEWLSPVLSALRGEIIKHRVNQMLTFLKKLSRGKFLSLGRTGLTR
jgi:hypothetical protein